MLAAQEVIYNVDPCQLLLKSTSRSDNFTGFTQDAGESKDIHQLFCQSPTWLESPSSSS